MSAARPRRALCTLCVLAIALAIAATSASAAVQLGAGSEEPQVAFDPGTGTTYTAWVGASDRSIDLCVLASGATGCTGGGPLELVDPEAEGGKEPLYARMRLAIEPGGAAVIASSAEGVAPTVEPAGYSGGGVAVWSSAPGGGEFFTGEHGLAAKGKLLAPVSGDGPNAGIVALGESPMEVGEFGDSTFGDGFGAFNLTTPTAAKLPLPDTSGTKKEGLYEHDLGALSSQVAALLSTPAKNEDLVVAVGTAPFTGGTVPGCPGAEQVSGFGWADTTFAGLGTQGNWHGFTPIACAAEAPVVAGGASGIGVAEDEGTGLEGTGSDSVDYRPFNATAREFGAPVQISNETAVSILGADDLSISQDSAGGIYVMWLDERGFEMSYSSTGGASWGVPVASLLPQQAGDPMIVGVGGGSFEVAYTANLGTGAGKQEYLQALNYAQLLAIQNAPAPPSPPPPPAPTVLGPKIPATISSSTKFEGETVGLSVPNQCIKDGKVVGTLTFKLPSHKRKGKVVVKIYKVIFKVTGDTVTITRKKLLDKPFVAKLKIKHPKAGTKYVLTARAFIKVKHGPPRSKTLHLTLTTCA